MKRDKRKHAIFRRLGLIAGTAVAVSMPMFAAGQGSLEERLEEVRRQVEARKEQPTSASNVKPVEMLQKLFYEEITVDFDETPVQEAIAYIGDAIGVRMVGRFASDMTANGIDPNLTVTLQAEDMSALAALDFVLAVCSTNSECIWQLRNGYIEIGPKDRLAMGGAQETKRYPISDLLMDVPDFDNMPSMLLEDQLSGGWYGPYDRGYGGSGHWYGPGYGISPRIIRGGRGGVIGGGHGGSINPGGMNPGRPLDKRAAMKQKAEELMAFIKAIVEPGHWRDEGGEWASMAYYDGVLVIRAPDFIHRQIGGYPKVPNPKDTPEADASGGQRDGEPVRQDGPR